MAQVGLNVETVDGDAGRQPIVLIHGAWHGAWCWRNNFQKTFGAAGHPTHALDLRGHGQSPPRRAMRWNSMSDYADDVEAVVATLDQPPVLLGHSMGGQVAQHIAARGVPLAGVVLLASAPAHGVLGSVLTALRMDPVKFAKVNLTLSLGAMVEDRARALRYFVEDDADATIRKNLIDNLGDESYRAFLDMLVLNLPRRPPEGLPGLVVSGADDVLMSVAGQRRLARRWNAAHHILPDTPHNIMMSKKRDQAAAIILDWIKGLGTV